MKKQFAVIAAIAFASVSLLQAQDAPSPDAAASSIPESPDLEPAQPNGGVPIEEPSGAQPDPELPAPSPTPPDFPPTPVDPTGGQADATGSDTNVTTVTVSQTFTNAGNAITVVGKVNSEDEKQKVEQALQQALPDKEINNHLTVSSERITEPSGAEKPQDDLDLDDKEDDLNENETEIDVGREFETDEQASPQSLP